MKEDFESRIINNAKVCGLFLKYYHRTKPKTDWEKSQKFYKESLSGPKFGHQPDDVPIVTSEHMASQTGGLIKG